MGPVLRSRRRRSSAANPVPRWWRKWLLRSACRGSQVLGAQSLDNGPVWLGLLLDSPDTVLGLEPDHRELERLGHKVGVAAVHAGPAAGPHLEVRAFAAPIGITEDPVTGSLNASLAQWLIDERRLPARYLAAQGACLERAGRVHIERDASGQVWVGGESVTCISGDGDAVTPVSRIDHLVVAADSLEQGAQWCEATLGIRPRRAANTR